MATNSWAFDRFQKSMDSINELLELHKLLVAGYPLLKSQSDELLRAIIVLSVSALDNYLHDFYRIEIVEAYLGKGNFDVQFDRINVSIKVLKGIEAAFSEVEKRNFLDFEIRKLQKTDSFQSPKSVEYIFTNIGVKGIWSKLEAAMGLSAQKIKEELGIIIDRRNKISHESDWDYFHERKNQIEFLEVENVVKFIANFVGAMNSIMP